MDPIIVLAVLAAIAAVVLGVLAWRGVISWAWMAAAIGGAVGLLGMRSGRSASAHADPGAPPPRPASAAGTVAPILRESDGRAEEEREAILDANDDTDATARLDRLAGLNGGGRQ